MAGLSTVRQQPSVRIGKARSRILTSVSPSCTQGRSRVREFRLHGFGRGTISNDRPYRASGHPATWTCAENLLTLGLRASGAGLAMKRREFITLVGGVAAWPLAAQAQQPVAGAVTLGLPSPVGIAGASSVFIEALGRLGYQCPWHSVAPAPGSGGR
jgi:hypothetical protein